MSLPENLPTEAAPPSETAAAQLPEPAAAPSQAAPVADGQLGNPADAALTPESAGAPVPDDTPDAPAATEAVPSDATEPAAAEAAPAAGAVAAERGLSPAQTAHKLAELFPALFAGPPKPIKLRIQADITLRAPGLFTKRVMSFFLSRHTTTTPYLKALVAQTQRFDLDGQPAGEINEEHRAAAVEELARRKQIVETRRAAERAAQREQRRPDSPAEPGAQRPPRGDMRGDMRGGPRGEPSHGPQAGPHGQPRGGQPGAGRPDRPRHNNAAPAGQSGGQAFDQGRPPAGERQRPPRGAGPRPADQQQVRTDQRPDHRPNQRHGAGPAEHDRGHRRNSAAADRPPEARPPRPEARHEHTPTDPAQRERAFLLRAWESSSLTKANFCALKRMTEAQFDATLEQARQERGAPRGA